MTYLVELVKVAQYHHVFGQVGEQLLAHLPSPLLFLGPAELSLL